MIGLSCDPRIDEEIDDKSGIQELMEATQELADCLEVSPANIIDELTHLIQKQTTVLRLRRHAFSEPKANTF